MHTFKTLVADTCDWPIIINYADETDTAVLAELPRPTADRYSHDEALTRERYAMLFAASPELLAALENYQRLVEHLQRVANPEDWSTYGDWSKLQREAAAAIARATK